MKITVKSIDLIVWFTSGDVAYWLNVSQDTAARILSDLGGLVSDHLISNNYSMAL